MALSDSLQTLVGTAKALEGEVVAANGQIVTRDATIASINAAMKMLQVEFDAYKLAHPDDGEPGPDLKQILTVLVSADANGQRIDFTTSGPVNTYGHNTWMSGPQDVTRRNFNLTFLAAGADIPVTVNWPDGTKTDRTVRTGTVTPPVDPPVPTTGLRKAWGGYSRPGSTAVLAFEAKTAPIGMVPLMEDYTDFSSSNSAAWLAFGATTQSRIYPGPDGKPYQGGPPWTPEMIGNRKFNLNWRSCFGNETLASFNKANHEQAIAVQLAYMREGKVKPGTILMSQCREFELDWYPDSLHRGGNTIQQFIDVYKWSHDTWTRLDTDKLIYGWQLAGSAFRSNQSAIQAERTKVMDGLKGILTHLGFDYYIAFGETMAPYKADLDWWVAQAKARGLKWGIPEIGALPGNDDPAIVSSIVDWCLANNIDHFCWFDSQEGGVALLDTLPKTKARLLAYLAP